MERTGIRSKSFLSVAIRKHNSQEQYMAEARISSKSITRFHLIFQKMISLTATTQIFLSSTLINIVDNWNISRSAFPTEPQIIRETRTRVKETRIKVKRIMN